MNIRNDMTDREMYIYFVGQMLIASKLAANEIDAKASWLVNDCRERYGHQEDDTAVTVT